MDNDLYDQYRVQDNLQQKQLNAQTSLHARDIFEQGQQSQAVLVEQTNPKKIVHEIILRLRGLDRAPNGDLIRMASPKLNQAGIEEVWFILDSHINQGVILSHLEANEIRNIMDVVQQDLVHNLALNWQGYGINKKSDLDTINDSILTNIFMALKRAEGQNEKNWLGKISVENISNNPNSNIKREGGFWSKLRL